MSGCFGGWGYGWLMREFLYGLLVSPDREWMFRAMCREEHVGLFFPPSGARPVSALRLCEVCPVRGECLEFALVNNVHYGVWGGMTERQRFKEKRRRKAERQELEG